MSEIKRLISLRNSKLLDETNGCLLLYVKKPLRLQELEKLDNSFINNSPEGRKNNE